jgi:hypothetical protein
MGAATTVTTTIRLNQDGTPRERKKGPPAVKKTPKADSNLASVRMMIRIAAVLNSNWLQTLLYLIFVILFQSLAQTMRIPQEYLVDKHVMDRLIDNDFDSSHNTFNDVRRIPDIYEWGNNVLWPGLFADLGPCGDPIGSRASPKACQDDVWPDGDGVFSLQGATPLGVEELVERMDKFDWSEGISLRQIRASAAECPSTSQLGRCYPQLQFQGTPVGSQEPFGYNYTHPGSPLAHPFTYFTAEQLGSNPKGMVSAAIPSMATHETSGFVALVIPFFSDTYLPAQEGTAAQVIDYRKSYVNTSNGRTAKYFCVRSSTNGLHLKQLCDPGTNGDGTGALTGAVRAHVETFWNDLKRAHWIDSRTRVIAIFGQLKSNYVGVRYRITMMFELTALGAVLPSYDVETRIIDSQQESNMGMFALIALILVIVFSLLEGVECAYYGAWTYFSDMWNLMDWSNFVIYYLVYIEVQRVQSLIRQRDCSSYLCQQVGYFDDWELMGSFRTCKTYLSLCVCIQLFKCLKFASALVPKMGLATNVLRQCAVDLLFFGVTFVISMLAFSMMLNVQIGPQMEGYRDQISAFISLFRALFGDFDIQEILDNSSGYLNTLLFLIYLFVAVFIMLSMFLAILAEAQVAVRETESQWREDPSFREYGVISYFYDTAKAGIVRVLKGVGFNLDGPAARVVVADAVVADDAASAADAPAKQSAIAGEPAAVPLGGDGNLAPADLPIVRGLASPAPPPALPAPPAPPLQQAEAGRTQAETAAILKAIAALHGELHELRSKLPDAAWI